MSVFCDSCAALRSELARVEASRDEAWKIAHAEGFPHMCRDGHAEIRYSDSSEERCPVCRVIDERDSLAGRVEQMREALGPDASGRPFEELLRVAADVLLSGGGGPVEDCLRLKADQVRAALASKEGGK